MIYYSIDLPYASYSIGVDNNVVVKTPPIAKWMIGKDLMYIGTWVKNKLGTMYELRSK